MVVAMSMSVMRMRNLQDVLENELRLDLGGWELEEAFGVSADGLIVVGYGANPDGRTEGWIARLPEPTTLLLFVPGVLVMMRRPSASG